MGKFLSWWQERLNYCSAQIFNTLHCNFIHYLNRTGKICTFWYLLRQVWLEPVSLQIYLFCIDPPHLVKMIKIQALKKLLDDQTVWKWWVHVEDFKVCWKMRFDQSFEWTLEFLTFTKMKRVFSFLRVFHLSDTPQLCKAQKCTEQISRVSHNEIVVWDISSRKSSGARVKTYLRCPSAPDRNKCHLLFAFISFLSFR